MSPPDNLEVRALTTPSFDCRRVARQDRQSMLASPRPAASHRRAAIPESRDRAPSSPAHSFATALGRTPIATISSVAPTPPLVPSDFPPPPLVSSRSLIALPRHGIPACPARFDRSVAMLSPLLPHH